MKAIKLADLNDAHANSNTDHGTLWKLEDNDAWFLSKGSDPAIITDVSKLSDLSDLCDINEIGLLMQELDIDDPEDLGVSYTTTAEWMDDADCESESSITVKSKAGRVLHENGLWFYGRSEFGEDSFSDINSTGRKLLDSWITEILKNEAWDAASRHYSYDGSNWSKDVDEPAEELTEEPDDEHQFAILKTAFHGGGIEGYAESEESAEQWISFLQDGSSCTCGCFGVIPVSQLEDVPCNDGNYHPPYSLMR